jgi:autotransporter-associated beta strand protein
MVSVFQKYCLRAINVLLIALWGAGAISAVGQTWNVDGNGDWNTAGNWTSPATAPNSTDASVTWDNTPGTTSSRTIRLTSNRLLGSLSIDSSMNYFLDSDPNGRQLRFDVSSGSASISVDDTNGSGSHTIDSQVRLLDDLVVTQNSATSFTISRQVRSHNAGTKIMSITGSGDTTLSARVRDGSGVMSLAKSGSGQLTLSRNNSDFTGSVSVTDGTLLVTAGGALGATSGSTSVSASGSLQLSGGIAVGAEGLDLSGIGGGNGALRNVSGDNGWDGNIVLGSASTINSDSGTLTLGSSGFTESIDTDGFTLTLGGAGNIVLNAALTDSGSLVKNHPRAIKCHQSEA